VGDGCRSKRPESLETPCRRADERITGEAAQELGVVGFCGEDEAKRLERALGLAALEPHSQEPFARLPDASERRPAAGLEDRGQDAVLKDPCPISGAPRREPE
jgi:hypothetical protein